MMRRPPRSTLFPYPPLFRSARDELAALGVVAERPHVTGLDVVPPGDPELAEDQAVLASWRQLLDVGTLQRDEPELAGTARPDRKSTRLNSSHANISHAVFCL